MATWATIQRSNSVNCLIYKIIHYNPAWLRLLIGGSTCIDGCYYYYYHCANSVLILIVGPWSWGSAKLSVVLLSLSCRLPTLTFACTSLCKRWRLSHFSKHLLDNAPILLIHFSLLVLQQQQNNSYLQLIHIKFNATISFRFYVLKSHIIKGLN